MRDAKNADEAFFTGTAAEIVPIGLIDYDFIGMSAEEKEKLKKSTMPELLPHCVEEVAKEGKITRFLRGKYSDAVHGREEKYEEWLTYI